MSYVTVTHKAPIKLKREVAEAAAYISGMLESFKNPLLMPSTSTAHILMPPEHMKMWRGPKTPPPSPSSPSLRPRPPPPTDPFELFDSAHRLSSHATLKRYYRFVFALIRGGPRHPPLPLELVIYLVRLARFPSPYPSRRLSGLLSWRPSLYKPDYNSGAIRPPMKLVPLLTTAPLTSGVLETINKLEVIVNLLLYIYYYVSVISAI